MSTTPPLETLRQVIELAGRAPSVHNSQPWRWRSTNAGLELHADTSRKLQAADPLGRNMVMSCGAALHHLRVAAAALGWESEVRREPGRSGSSLLAAVRLRPARPPDHAASDLRAIAERCTDLRRFTAWPVPDEPLHRLARVAAAEGTHAVPLLAVTQRFRAELLMHRAIESQTSDRAVTREQQRLAGRSAVNEIPVCHGRSSSGPEDSERLIEGSDGLLVLGSGSDDVASWLSAGEGLSALWLAATTLGMSVVPLSQVVEVAETRQSLEHDVLDGQVRPLLLVRIGWQEISRSQLPRTARRPVDEILDLR